MKHLNRTATLLLAFVCTSAFAQTPTPPPAPLQGDLATHSNIPAAKPADVNSVDAIITALYSVISGPKGQPRDWDRMRSLFLPSARLIPARAADIDGTGGGPDRRHTVTHRPHRARNFGNRFAP